MKKFVMTAEQLAAHWGLTPRQIRSYAQEGVAVRSGTGYDVIESDRRLIAWLRRDEPTQRLKREQISWKSQEIERRLQDRDREWLQLAEAQRLIESAWEALRRGHAAGLNALYSAAAYSLGAETARVLAGRCEQQVNGEMVLARQALEAIHRGALETMQSELRNGILISTRRARASEAALGETRGNGTSDA